MRKDLAGIYQMMSKVKNLSQDRKEFMSSGLPTIQDLTFNEDPLGGYSIPEPIHEQAPELKPKDKKEEKTEEPKIKTKAEQDEEDRKKKEEEKFQQDLIDNPDEALDMPDRFL